MNPCVASVKKGQMVYNKERERERERKKRERERERKRKRREKKGVCDILTC